MLYMHKLTLYILGSLLLGSSLVGLALMSSTDTASPTVHTPDLEGVVVTLYRSPTCGCCAGHAAALEAAGATVDMYNVDEVTLQDIKQEHKLPFNKQSCHTAIINDYVVEGHVPVTAISKLVEENPDTRGITLPGMPIGTPGMPGRQTEPYIVETLEGSVYWRTDSS